MRVYYHGERRNHTVYVAPAADPRFNDGQIASDWISESGDPITFEVCFVDGAAKVPDSLGRYLIKTGQAKRTRLWLPAGFVDKAA